MAKKGKKTNFNKKNKKQAKPANKSFIWLAMAFALFVIGIHQSLTIGFEYSYWIFMLSICLLLLHRIKNKTPNNADN